MLGGLNHILAIWLESGSYFIRFLSSRLGKTHTARIGTFCCCNSWRIDLMRRRVTYALGGHFIAPHKSMLILSYLGDLWEAFWSSLGLLRARVDDSAALFDAQAAQIRVGVLFLIFLQKHAS